MATATHQKRQRNDIQPTVVTIELDGCEATHHQTARIQFSIRPAPLIPVTAKCIMRPGYMGKWRIDEAVVTGLPYELNSREKYGLRRQLVDELHRRGYLFNPQNKEGKYGFSIDRITEVFE